MAFLSRTLAGLPSLLREKAGSLVVSFTRKQGAESADTAFAPIAAEPQEPRSPRFSNCIAEASPPVRPPRQPLSSPAVAASLLFLGTRILRDSTPRGVVQRSEAAPRSAVGRIGRTGLARSGGSSAETVGVSLPWGGRDDPFVRVSGPTSR